MNPQRFLMWALALLIGFAAVSPAKAIGTVASNGSTPARVWGPDYGPVLCGWPGGTFQQANTTSTDASTTAGTAYAAACKAAGIAAGNASCTWNGGWQILDYVQFKPNMSNCGQYGNTTQSSSATTMAACPSNSANSGGTCVCNTGYRPNTGATACVATTGACQTIVDAANMLLPSSFFEAAGALPGTLSVCNSGCQIGAQGSTVVIPPGGTAATLYFGPFTLVSNTCTETAAAPAASETNECPPGQVPGEISGTTHCYTPQTATSSSSAAASAPAGAASAPEYSAGLPGGGSVVVPAGGTATSTTTCSGANCTTTTTVKNAGGTTVGTYTSNTPNPAGQSGGTGEEDTELACEDINTCDDAEGGTTPGAPTLPERQELYEREYPDGLQGVWEDKREALRSTELASMADSLFPTGLTTGTAPSWTFDLNFGPGMNFGEVNLAPDPSIWPMIRLFCLACALVFAVRLVLGG